MGHILFTAIVGALSGFCAWLISEPMMPPIYGDPRGQTASLVFVVLLGAFIAGSVGALTGYRQGSRRHLITGLLIGLVAGAMAGSIGGAVGGGLAFALFPGFDRGLGVSTLPGRIVQITPLGALIGLAIGLPLRSPKQATLGLIGGAIGGAIAGAAFDPLSVALQSFTQLAQGGNEIGKPGRAAMAVVLGGSIGLFVSLAREVAKTAWLRLRLGRNEGREWVVDAPQTFIGRDERAHVPLFGDGNIAPMHACIVRHGRDYVIHDGGTPLGIMVDGQRVPQAVLNHGSVIEIGGHTLEFSLKGGRAPVRPPDQVSAVSAPASVVMPSAPAAPAGASLTILNGPNPGQQVRVVDAVEIGREASGLRLDHDRNASRRHARIELSPSGLMITDLGSTNGTFVNDQRITQSPIRSGDRIRIGGTELRVD
ncbi:MAG: FHA domain-containing protein [Methanoregulaceae archaeon]|nr:FHA domain-containing protein [Methanoregulaceae archaeon]